MGATKLSTVPSADIDIDQAIDGLTRIYTFDSGPEVTAFLRANPELCPVLEDAPERIHDVFGNSARLHLELFHDLEEGWERPFIIIRTQLDAGRALKLECRLSECWYLNLPSHIQQKMNFTEEPDV